MRVDSVGAARTYAPVPATQPGTQGKAYGVIKKLGTGHYREAVESKLTTRFAPNRLPQPQPEPQLLPRPGAEVIIPGVDPAPEIQPVSEITPVPESGSDQTTIDPELGTASLQNLYAQALPTRIDLRA